MILTPRQFFLTVSSFLLSYNVIKGQSNSNSQSRSLLPGPNGPFYGFPYSPDTFGTRLLPLTVAGTCKNGTVYTITKMRDITTMRSELECVFNAALAPDKVPTGPMYGKFNKFYNTPIFNLIAWALWEGKYIQKEECTDKNTFLGWNVFRQFSRPLFPFSFSIKPITLNLAPGEYNNKENALNIDYSADVRTKCPNYRHFLDEPSDIKNRKNKTTQGSTSSKKPIGIHPYFDVLRFVGKQEDGGSIYLGKAYMLDLFRDDEQAVTITFWTVVSYDPDVMRDFAPGQSLPPLKESFNYIHPGIVDLPLRLLPVDNFLTSPIKTLSKVVQGGTRIGRELQLYFRDIRQSGYLRHPPRFRNAYNADKPSRRSRRRMWWARWG